ncbi:MAG TPA: isoprenylcysteine carboxylmethyltransferase family protein [Terriglobales bacterium]|nr:isoprenylcysteine carboxylmethyltransferase family protein [Terriglobales bacterium]
MAQRVFLAIRTLLYASGFFLVLAWLLPAFLNISSSPAAPSQSPWRTLGILPLLIGLAIILWCVTNFVVEGKGTPAPFDPPRRLVVTGPYCYMRNPMYVGGLLFLIGYAVLFVEFSITLLWYAVALIVAVNIFILAYEEPILKRKFGGDYEKYCRNVHRWMPRLHPWHPQSEQAVRAGT